MSQTLNLKVKGLFTSFNEFSEAPEGALLTADNIEILQDSIAQPRRGFDRVAGGFASSSHRSDALVEFDDHLISHHGSTIGSAANLSYYDAATWTSIGSFTAPSSIRMKFVKDNGNLYYTTNAGVYKLAAYNGTPVLAGAYKGLDVTASNSVNVSGWLANGSSVAYRVVWGYKDANDNLVLGAPSQREAYTNSSGSVADVSLVVTIPAGVTTAWFVQVYRSAAIVGTPNEELGLVYEINPDSSEITAKSLTIVDIVPDALRGATIYTASSQEGLVSGNEQPPLARDIATFGDSVFYANTTAKHRFNLTLLAVGGTDGIANDDTITIGGITYTGKATETVASAQFDVVTGGSAAANIASTARSLVRVINRHTSSTVYAYYLSSADDLPGKILLEERAVGGAAFVVVASKPASWTPTDIPTSGTTKTSTNDMFPNGLAWSKTNQPEAVPLTNFVQVGSKNNGILRIVSLREGLYVFKDNEGVFKVSGYYPNFQVDKIDDSVNLLAPESVQVLNNQIYCLSDQGVTVVTDTTKVISRPIEQDILSLVNQNLALVESVCFGLAYESDRKYYLFLPRTSVDTSPTQAFVYNIFTNAWTRHVLTATAALIDSDKQFYYGHGTDEYLRQERKNYSFLDYSDFGFTDTIVTAASTSITINSGFDNVAVGDILYQSAALFATVSAVDPVTQIITVESNPGLTVAAVTVLKSIPTVLKWAPVTLSNPAIQKQFHTATLLFKTDFTGDAELAFSSDISQFDEAVTLEGRGIGLWGLFGWGERPWGGTSLKRPVRQWIPRAKQRASQLSVTFSHSWAYSSWQLIGLSLFGTEGSEKVSK